MAEAKDRPDVELFAEVGRIDQLFRKHLERALPRGLTAAQFAVLNHFVLRGAPQGPAALAATFHLTKGAMTNTLQRLQAQGLVSVQADGGDGRRKVVALTEAGLEAHAACISAFRAESPPVFSARVFMVVLLGHSKIGLGTLQ